MKVGIWWDLSAEMTLDNLEPWADRLAEMGIFAAWTVVHKARKLDGLLPIRKWSPSQWATWSAALKSRGIESAISSWTWSNRDVINGQAHDLERLVQAHYPYRLEYNAEDDFKPRRLRGYEDIGDCANHLVGLTRQYYRGPLEVSSYPYHQEMGGASELTHLCQYAVTEAYSKYVKGDESYAWEGNLGPGSMQRFAINRARLIGSTVVCGLANFSQTYPGHAPQQAMHEAAAEALRHGVEEIRYWSAKFCFHQRHKNSYAEDTIKAIARRMC